MFASRCRVALSVSLFVSTPIAASTPLLPQAFIDTSFVATAGNKHVVGVGDNLQAAVDRAVPGDTIVLQAGAVFKGPITLPAKSGSGWIHIRSSAYESLPAPGNRVRPADSPNMPAITVGKYSGSAIQAGKGAHHFRFVGIEIKPAPGTFVYNLVDVGGGQRAIADLPHDIVFDRCYIHGDPVVGGRRGIAMNGIRIAVVDSHVSDFKEDGADTQALWTFNTPGPLKITNNFLEAAGENFMAGGADPRIENVVPADIEIRGNHFFKPLSWIGQRWTVKNLLELKSAKRVLVEGNVFENNWLAAQSGFSVLLTPRNQDGKAPWNVVQDVIFRLNKFVNVGQGFVVSGRDGTHRSEVTRGILIEHNLLLVSRLQNADGRIFQIVGGPIDVTIRNNTGLITVRGGTSSFSENSPKADRVVFNDNLLSNGDYGFLGTGTGPGVPTLERHFASISFKGNVLVGGGGNYPAGNSFPVNADAVGFIDFAGGNYRLSARSPYRTSGANGGTPGADFDLLERAVAGAIKGEQAPN